MILKTFLRKTEFDSFNNFMEELKSKRRIKYVSRLDFISLSSENHTGVYITGNKQVISVFIETGKPNSLKTIAA